MDSNQQKILVFQTSFVFFNEKTPCQIGRKPTSKECCQAAAPPSLQIHRSLRCQKTPKSAETQSVKKQREINRNH